MNNLLSKRWELGFVFGGYEQVLSQDRLEVKWLKRPFKDRWFADPFILDVTDTHIIVLAEELRYAEPKGRIAKLVVNKKTMRLESMDIVLEETTHLSFPNIIRYEGKIYVCPENCKSGKLNLYEYDADNNSLSFVQTICNDAVWDATVTDLFGGYKLFTAKKDDFHLDIYDWNGKLFEFSQTVKGECPNMRMAGQLFEYNGKVYCPSQDCSLNYGGAVDVKQVDYQDGKFEFVSVKKLTSPHKTLKLGLHTLNAYKNVAVIDVRGFNNPIIELLFHIYQSSLNGRRDIVE